MIRPEAEGTALSSKARGGMERLTASMTSNQGHLTCPVYFVFFINELANNTTWGGRQGVQFSPNDIEICWRHCTSSCLAQLQLFKASWTSRVTLTRNVLFSAERPAWPLHTMYFSQLNVLMTFHTIYFSQLNVLMTFHTIYFSQLNVNFHRLHFSHLNVSMTFHRVYFSQLNVLMTFHRLYFSQLNVLMTFHRLHFSQLNVLMTFHRLHFSQLNILMAFHRPHFSPLNVLHDLSHNVLFSA